MPYYVDNPTQYLKKKFTYAPTQKNECAYFAQMVAKPTLGPARLWRPSIPMERPQNGVVHPRIRTGVVIATFNENGRYPQGDDRNSSFDAPHTAIFLNYEGEKALVLEQYGDTVVHEQRFYTGHTSRYYDLKRFFVVENFYKLPTVGDPSLEHPYR